jgi:hypothetical protein
MNGEVKRTMMPCKDNPGHYPIWRCIAWMAEDGGEETGEIEVCGICVPKHSSFPSRESVPVWQDV